MSQRAYEAIIPLHEYDLRPDPNAPNLTRAPGGSWTWLAPLSLYCYKCGLALTAWSVPPALDAVVRVARDHELSAHHRAPSPAGTHRPGGGP